MFAFILVIFYNNYNQYHYTTKVVLYNNFFFYNNKDIMFLFNVNGYNIGLLRYLFVVLGVFHMIPHLLVRTYGRDIYLVTLLVGLHLFVYGTFLLFFRLQRFFLGHFLDFQGLRLVYLGLYLPI